jgi:hypothetical protein
MLLREAFEAARVRRGSQQREPPRTTGSDVVRERLVELQLTILAISLASVANNSLASSPPAKSRRV